MKAADAYLVITNLPDRGSAAKLAHELVEKRLAACINILSPCRSIYRWKGKTEDAAGAPRGDAHSLTGRSAAGPGSLEGRVATLPPIPSPLLRRR